MEAENMVQMDLFGGEGPLKSSEVEKLKSSKTFQPFNPSTMQPTMVRVAPGRHAWIPRDKATPPDGYALCRWSRQADGTYAPVPVAGRYVRLNSQVAASLGFVSDGTSDRNRYDTILRLGRAGFIDLVRVAPNTILLDLDSWYRHLADCMDNPEMWDEGSEDLKIYLKANDLGGWKRNV